MNHLPFPQGVKPPTVLFVGTLNNNTWDTFSKPPLLGEIKDETGKFSFGRSPPEVYQAFFQTWLYFGCLAEVSDVINLPIDTARFVQRTTHGVTIVTSASLNEYLDSWRDRAAEHPRTQKAIRKENERLDKILGTMRKMLRGPLHEFRRFLADHYPSSPVTSSWPNIALSIAALGYTFQQVSNTIYSYHEVLSSTDWGVQWALRERLQGSHWCKALIAKFLAEECIDFLLFVGSIPYPRASESHERCTDTVCRSRVSTTKYKTAHVVEGCACEFGEMPSQAAAIVNRGGIPLVTWSDEDGLQVVEYQGDMAYVAISHVWSDGKGNDVNALPECQLRNIQKKIEALYATPRKAKGTLVPFFGPRKRHEPRDVCRRPEGFWMDTLCVPVGKSEKARELRRKAIIKMREIYEGADRVLVLDDRVQKHSTSSPFCDRAISLIVSNWQTRIWTLQEGVMAQQLFIQFSDGVSTVEDLQEEEGGRIRIVGDDLCPSPGFWHRVTTGLLSLFSIGLRFDPKELDPGQFPAHELFDLLIPVAKKRLTSWREDETICLSALMRLEPDRLLEIRWNFSWEEVKNMPIEKRLAEETRVCEARMKEFLCMIGRFNKLIIFSELPRLSGDGFRWAPSSFLGQSGTSSFVRHEWFHQVTHHKEPHAPIKFRDISGSPDEVRRPDNALGLLVTFPGIMLHTVPRSLMDAGTFYVREKGYNRFLYRVTLRHSPLLIDDKHTTSQYALITLDAPTSDREDPIPAIFGIILGMMDTRVRKFKHLSVARVKAVVGKSGATGENAKTTRIDRDMNWEKFERGDAWIDEESDEDWEDKLEANNGNRGSGHVDNLERSLSEKGSQDDSEDGWESEKRSELDGNSGIDSDSSEDADSEIDGETDEEECGSHSSEDGGNQYDHSATGTNGTQDSEGVQDDETPDSDSDYDSGDDDQCANSAQKRDSSSSYSTEQLVYGKVLFMDNNKWCIV